MTETAPAAADDKNPPVYANWAGRNRVMPRFILQHVSGTMLRLQPRGTSGLALILCALSVVGLMLLGLIVLNDSAGRNSPPGW